MKVVLVLCLFTVFGCSVQGMTLDATWAKLVDNLDNINDFLDNFKAISSQLEERYNSTSNSVKNRAYHNVQTLINSTHNQYKDLLFQAIENHLGTDHCFQGIYALYNQARDIVNKIDDCVEPTFVSDDKNEIIKKASYLHSYIQTLFTEVWDCQSKSVKILCAPSLYTEAQLMGVREIAKIRQAGEQYLERLSALIDQMFNCQAQEHKERLGSLAVNAYDMGMNINACLSKLIDEATTIHSTTAAPSVKEESTTEAVETTQDQPMSTTALPVSEEKSRTTISEDEVTGAVSEQEATTTSEQANFESVEEQSTDAIFETSTPVASSYELF